MQDLKKLEQVREAARKKYEAAKKEIQFATNISLAAQEANDTWLEYKKLDDEFNNSAVLKEMVDLYGC